jgi:phosphoribosyl-ATP pyrophosphohydrolase
VVAEGYRSGHVSNSASVPERFSKNGQKLTEKAIEVVIDVVNGKNKAVVCESADLLYNLSVLWVAAGVRPQDIWDEMNRREQMQGIVEKLPKRSSK